MVGMTAGRRYHRRHLAALVCVENALSLASGTGFVRLNRFMGGVEDTGSEPSWDPEEAASSSMPKRISSNSGKAEEVDDNEQEVIVVQESRVTV